MTELNGPIRQALDSGDVSRARELLKDALQESPNVETYQLAARAALDDAQRERFLKLASTSSKNVDANQAGLIVGRKAQKNSDVTAIQDQFSDTEITRLAAAGAITQGERFRKFVISHYRFPYQATAPELCLNPEIVLRVCEHLETEFKSHRWLWIIAIIVGLALGVVPAIIVSVIWAASIANREEAIRKKYLHYFSADKYDPKTIRQVFNKCNAVDNLPHFDQNVVVYKGFHPFVGAGIYLGGWSFAVDIGTYHNEATKEPVKPDYFQLTEIYDAIVDHLTGLQFDNVQLRDYVFAYGSDIRSRSELLPRHDSRPLQRIDQAVLNRYIDSNEWGMRYYKWIILYDWNGEIVLSFFLRISRRGVRNLFFEFNTYLMPPLHESFHLADRVVETSTERLARIAAQQKMNANTWQKSFRELVVSGSKKEVEELRKELDGNLRYNYGVAQSIREYVSAKGYTRFFQLMDKEMYVKIIEKEIFRAINKFLEDHHVNIEDLRSKQSFIINQGIMVQGNVSGEGIAIGSGAQASSQSGTSATSLVSRLAGSESKST